MAHILIIEDDQLMSRLYEKAFTFAGYEIDVASDGEEGLEKLRDNRPTLVLLDIMMPKMNGLEVLDKIKADPDIKNIPVIVLTNLASEKDAETALVKGAVKYMVKSEHGPKETVDIVKEILSGYTRNEIPKATQ